jgi:hypothetical protein
VPNVCSLTVELTAMLSLGKLSPKLTVDSTEVAYIVVLSFDVPNASVLSIASGYVMNIVVGDPKAITESMA